MGLLRYSLYNIAETFLRLFPFRTKTGLIKIGNPGRNSPVLLTGNFHLTVERVRRSLKGMDVFLLVANSRGMNVWCAAAGGHLINHSVISLLKTSGIEERVEHRNIILPQLAATGIESKVIFEKTGWKVIWGPVYAMDIQSFIQHNLEKTPEMREVRFFWKQRLEMAFAWAFPISVISSIIMLAVWSAALPALIPLIWGLSSLIFLSFPLYSRFLTSRTRKIGPFRFDFNRGGLQLLYLGPLTAGLILYSLISGSLTLQDAFLWEIVLIVLVLVLTFDLSGSTPVYKSGAYENTLTITIDKRKCTGVGVCEQVCPRNCFTVIKDEHTATISMTDKCVTCGACIVQCPFDALSFKEPSGKTIPPEIIRKYKLNLKGRRAVKV